MPDYIIHYPSFWPKYPLSRLVLDRVYGGEEQGRRLCNQISEVACYMGTNGIKIPGYDYPISRLFFYFYSIMIEMPYYLGNYNKVFTEPPTEVIEKVMGYLNPVLQYVQARIDKLLQLVDDHKRSTKYNWMNILNHDKYMLNMQNAAYFANELSLLCRKIVEYTIPRMSECLDYVKQYVPTRGFVGYIAKAYTVMKIEEPQSISNVPKPSELRWSKPDHLLLVRRSPVEIYA